MRNKALLTLPFTPLIESLTENLQQHGREVESVPYLRGVLPTLKDGKERWEVFIMMNKLDGTHEEKEKHLNEATLVLEQIRTDRGLSHLKIIVLTDLPVDHPFLHRLVMLGIYNIFNGPTFSLESVIRTIAEPMTYSEVRQYVQATGSIWTQAAFPELVKTMLIKERKESEAAKKIGRSKLTQKVVEVKQRDIAVVSFYPAGASFVAVNLASLMSSKGKAIDLWDGDSQFPALYHYFGLDTRELQPEAGQPPIFQKGKLFVHTRNPHQQKAVGLSDYLDFYDEARSRSHHRILDISGRYEDEASQFVMKQATDILLVIDPNTIKWIHLYRKIEQWLATVQADKCRWILNRVDVSEHCLRDDLERLFHIHVDMMLPDLAKIQWSAFKKGVPAISNLSQQHPFSQNLASFVDKTLLTNPSTKWFDHLLPFHAEV